MVEYSLRGQGPWQGLSYESEHGPTTGRFRMIRGFIVSRDGTELQRVPGMALVAEPGYAQMPSPGDLVHGTKTRFSAQVSPNLIKDDGAVHTIPVYIRKNPNSAADLEDGWYLGDWIDSTDVDINVTSSSSTAAGRDYEEMWISRLGRTGVERAIHQAIECDGLMCVVFDGEFYYDATEANPPIEQHGTGEHLSLSAITASRALDFDSPLQPYDFDFWATSQIEHLVNDVLYARDTGWGYKGANELKYYTKRPDRKAQLEVYDGRVVVALPQYGCMFQIPMRQHALYDTYRPSGTAIPRVMDSLGIPKGVPTSGLVINGTGNPDIKIGSEVYLRVAYYNSHTNEYGRVSELIEATNLSGVLARGQLEVMVPRGVMRETNADHIVLYGSYNSNADPTFLASPTALRPLAFVKADEITIPNETTQVITFADTTLPVIQNLDNTLGPQFLPVMPMGALWARTMRGHLFSGGRMGSTAFVGQEVDTLRMTSTQDYVDIDDPFQLCAKGIGTGYEGRFIARVGSDIPSVERLITLRDASSISPHKMRWEFRGIQSGAAVTSGFGVQFPRSHAQFSPKERPGEAPAAQTMIFDRKEGREVVACGRYGNHLVVCTDRETYAVSWGQNPIGVDPQLISKTYGCIAPDSMVETDAGLFWLSHRGPVMFNGGVQWVGAAVAARFRDDVKGVDNSTVLDKRYLWTDAKFMWHVRGYFDSSRRSVCWIMRTDEHGTDFADAGISQNILSVTAANPVEISFVDDHRISIGTKVKVRIAGNTAQTGMNGDWTATSTDTTKLTIEFDNRDGTTTGSGSVRWAIDEEQSKVGGDELLMLNTDTYSFTTQRFPGDRKWSGATESTFVDGERRPILITGEPDVKDELFTTELHGDVFGVDDRYFDRLQSPVSVVATGGPVVSGSDLYFQAAGTDFRELLRWYSGSGAPFPCTYQAFIRSGTADYRGNYELKWWGHIDAIRNTTGDQVRVVTDQILPTPTWEEGDVIEIGVIHCELETNLMRLEEISGGRVKKGVNVRGLVLEHSFVRSAGDTPHAAWAFVQTYGDGVWTTAHPEDWGHPLAIDSDVSRVVGNMIVGRDVAIRLTVIANSRIALKDIRFDTGDST